MKKAYALFFIGIWVAILPELGFPRSWKEILFLISGLAIIYISYQFYRGSKISKGHLNHLPYQEIKPHDSQSY